MKMRNRRAMSYALLAAMPSVTSLAVADTKTWSQTTPGLFNTPTNWSPASAPGTNDVALFNTGAIVQWDNTTGNNNTAGLLINGGSIEFESNSTPFTYTAGTASLTSGTLLLNHQNLSVTGALDLESNANVVVSTSSSFTGSGTIPGSIILNSGSLDLSDNTNISGKLNYTGASTINIASGKTLTIADGAGSFTSEYLISNGASLAVTGGGTVTSTSSVDVGFENIGTLLVDGASSSISDGSLALWGFAGGQATITFSNGGVGTYSGGLQIGNGIASSVALVNIFSNSQLTSTTLSVGGASHSTANMNINGGTLTANNAVTIGNGATVTLTSGGLNLLGTTTTINPGGTFSYVGGTLNTAAGQTLTVNGQVLLKSGRDKTIRAGTLSIMGNGDIDLSDNVLIVDYSSTSPLSTIRNYIVTGRSGGNWSGTGISSSAAAAVAVDNSNLHKTALGYGEASTILGPSGGTFAGNTVDGTAVLVRYTLLGDANLDGTVNALDFNALATHYGTPTAGWTGGDFNYDNTVNASDFDALATNYGMSLSSSSSSSLSLVSVVPEPGYAMLLAVTAVGFFHTSGRRWAHKKASGA